MCGIFGCIYKDESPALDIAQKIKYSLGPLLGRRGPDAASAHCVGVGGGTTMCLEGAVLHMRDPLTPQPLVGSGGDALLWNGEVFAGLKMGPDESDTLAVFHALRGANSDDDLLKVLSSIKGPWAIIYWQSATQRLWFGRDVFGRRSLLWHTGDGFSEPFLLTSVASADGTLQGKGGGGRPFWSEVPAVGLFCASVKEMREGKPSLHCFPWTQCGSLYQDDLCDVITESVVGGFAVQVVRSDCLTVPFPPLNMDLPDNVLALVDDLGEEGEQGEVTHGANRCKCATEDTPYQQQGSVSTVKGQKTPFEAVTAFEGEDSGGGGVECSEKHPPAAVPRLLGPVDPASILLGLLKKAVEIRVHNLPAPLDVRAVGGGVRTGARLGILFSGGVDSVVMAALADLCLPPEEPIDLINVAFDQGSLPAKQSGAKSRVKTTGAGAADHHKPDYNVPDRVLALSSVKELRLRRKWQLILVNVEAAEAGRVREEHFRHLVYPLRTVLDDSIGCALWFAARGEGLLHHSGPREGKGEASDPIPCVSSAKALLVGIGADEQLAGYSRHRQRFLHGGWQGLTEEVDMDVKRISSRNLGRDDRCIGDHGREARFPFLDEDVVAYLQQLRIDQKVDLRLPRGVGEKKLLREVAATLGCHVGAAAPKRAIQFGSRVAKVTGSAGEQGSDVCSRLVQ